MFQHVGDMPDGFVFIGFHSIKPIYFVRVSIL